MHTPFALAPLAAEYIRTLGAGMNERYDRFDFPQRWRVSVWNGYAYFSLALPGHARGSRGRRQAVGADVPAPDRGDGRLVAQRRAPRAARRSTPGSRRSTSRAVRPRRWPRPGPTPGRPGSGAGRSTSSRSSAPYQVLDDLADLYERSSRAPPGEAFRSIQGTATTCSRSSSGSGPCRLGRVDAGGRGPRSATPAPSPARSCLALDGGAAFVAAAARLPRGARPPRPGLRRPRRPRGGRNPRCLSPRSRSGSSTRSSRRGTRGAAASRGGRARRPGARARLADRPGRAGRVRAPARAGARDRAAHRDAQLLDRPDGAGAAAGVRRCASARGWPREGVDRAARRRPLPPPRRGPGAARRARGPAGRRRRRGAPTTPRQRAIVSRRRVVGKPTTEEPARPVRRRAVRDGGRGERPRARAPRPGSSAGPPGSSLGPDDFGRVQPGDIIVCPSSNPSWVAALRDRRRARDEHRRRAVARGGRGPRVRPAGGRRDGRCDDADRRRPARRDRRHDAASSGCCERRASRARRRRDRGRACSRPRCSGVACGAILVPLNSTMLAVALPSIMGEFGVGAGDGRVARDAVPRRGRGRAAGRAASLGDRFGHRRDVPRRRARRSALASLLAARRAVVRGPRGCRASSRPSAARSSRPARWRSSARWRRRTGGARRSACSTCCLDERGRSARSSAAARRRVRLAVDVLARRAGRARSRPRRSRLLLAPRPAAGRRGRDRGRLDVRGLVVLGAAIVAFLVALRAGATTARTGAPSSPWSLLLVVFVGRRAAHARARASTRDCSARDPSRRPWPASSAATDRAPRDVPDGPAPRGAPARRLGDRDAASCCSGSRA